MPDAFMATTTAPGPGVGSGNSRSSSFRPPRKTTPRIRPPLKLPYHRSFICAPRAAGPSLTTTCSAHYIGGSRDADDEARRGDDLSRDRDRPLVVSYRVHAAGLERRGDRRPSPLAQASLLRRADRRSGLAHPDLRRADAAP